MGRDAQDNLSHDYEDSEAFVPTTHAVLGLKVADADEAATVRRVSFAVLGLVIFDVLNFFVHTTCQRPWEHAFVHLLFAAIIPSVGYVAVSQRWTKAAWLFHLLAIIWVVVKALILFVALLHLLWLKENGSEAICAKFAKPCEGPAASTPPMTFSPGREFWHCRGTLCIEAARHCDGEANCFDHSDEIGCLDAAALIHDGQPAAVPTVSVPSLPGRDMLECKHLLEMEARAQGLQRPCSWWLVMTGPQWLLCLYAAYHSLEFYVQLRVRSLSARVNGQNGDATVFDRAEMERQTDNEMAE